MKRLLIFAVSVAFSGSVFAGAVMPTSTRYTSGVLASPPALYEANVYTFTPPTSGGVPVNITANNIYPLPLPSFSNQVGNAVLGVGLAAGALFSAPAVVATMNVLAVGTAGYMLWQALHSNGVSVATDGTVNMSGPSTYSGYENGLTNCSGSSCVSGHYSSAYSACSSLNYGGPYGQATLTSPTNCHFYHNYAGSWMDTTISGVGAAIPGAPSPATNQDISNAVQSAVASSSVADDTLKYAISQGFDVKSMLPPATVNTAAAPAPYIGPEYTTGTQTDASGNTVRTTAQVTTMLTPGATAADRATAQQTTTVRHYLNNASSPSTSSTEVSTPSVLTPAQAGIPAGSTLTTSSSSTTLTLPTDYNREATQSTIAAALVVAPSVALADTETADMNALTGDSGTIIPHIDRTQMAGIVNFPSSGSCTPLTFMVAGQTFNADPCPMVNYLHPLVNYLFVFLFGILNLRLAFKNDEVAA